VTPYLIFYDGGPHSEAVHAAHPSRPPRHYA
jgi:hypothetical protein